MLLSVEVSKRRPLQKGAHYIVRFWSISVKHKWLIVRYIDCERTLVRGRYPVQVLIIESPVLILKQLTFFKKSKFVETCIRTLRTV